MPILSVENLSIAFQSERTEYTVVRDVSFAVEEGEVLGIVGESGCGKSVTSLAIMGLIPSPPGRITGGRIMFKDQDVTKLKEEELRHLRGNQISMIFQEPMTSLNPVYTIGNQLLEAIKVHHTGQSRDQVRKKAEEMLELVGINEPRRNMKSYPHQLSGGMRQRVMIAMALSCGPKILIADEPTTALDVTIQAQVLELMKTLRQNINTSIILITHDLGVIAEMAERVAIMYAGSIVEEAPVREIFKDYRHPYTEGLLNSIPKINEIKSRLYTIKGTVPPPAKMPEGCSFHPRCPYKTEICLKQSPKRVQVGEKHYVSCFRQAGGD